MVAMKNASFAIFVICTSCQWFASDGRLWTRPVQVTFRSLSGQVDAVGAQTHDAIVSFATDWVAIQVTFSLLRARAEEFWQ